MKTREIALVAAFSALAVASDFALTDLPNVKLVDPIVFSVAFVFGLEMGVYVGVLSEVIWGTLSPYGFGGYIIPFLVVGEVSYALAGWAASRVWREQQLEGLFAQPILRRRAGDLRVRVGPREPSWDAR